MYKKKLLACLGGMLIISGCNTLNYYKNEQPKMDIAQYFNGPIEAWGIVQDWRGRVVDRFSVTMVGKWRGRVGTLEEHFQYADGRTQQRTWTILKQSDGSYEGTAADILGKAIGKSQGNATNWHYYMDVPVGKTTYRLFFDDWMWQINDRIVINRSYLKKFGITVARLTLFMQKQAR